MNSTQKIVIVGGGFGGVYTAHHLQKWLPDNWEILLFSNENHFVFTPLLGDVVGSSINPMHVVWPIRQMVPRVDCRTAEVKHLDLENHTIHYQLPTGATAEQSYDHLVLACGAVVHLDIMPGMAAHGWPLKTMGDALLLRNHLIGLLEKAEVETNPERKRRLLSVAVVGAGFSGVEVAGEVMDLLRASSRFYRNVSPGEIRVSLLEGRERVLHNLPESLSNFTVKKMTRHGIDVRVNCFAQSVTEIGIHLQDGSTIEANTVVCTIGTTIHPLLATAQLPVERRRVITDGEMRIQGFDNVWAVGDCAAVPNAYDQQTSAPTAQLAVRQARQLANNILAVINDRPTRPFSYKPKGMLASIGNHKAVGLMFGLKISGFLAWFLWRGFYLSQMPSLARRIQIAFDWAWQLIFPRDMVQMNIGSTERFEHAHFEQGQFVFHRGDPGNKFYLIERGKAGVYLDESEPPVAFLKKGDHFGEGALLRNAPRSASVKAEEPLDVLVVGIHSFGELTQHMGTLRSGLERTMQGRLSTNQVLLQAKDNPRLQRVAVRDVMSQPVNTLPVDLTFGDALQQSQESGKGAYPLVNDAGEMVGICTRTDFYRALQRLQPLDTALSEIMHQPVVTVREDERLLDALVTFLREPIKRLVVVSEDNPKTPIGMLTPFDFLPIVAETLSPALNK